jgi:outer membrane lipoprotein-sorting protein
MKLKAILITASLLFFALSLSVTTASANGKLDQILANMQREGRTIKTIFAKLTQSQPLRDIGGTQTSRAQLFFKHYGPGNDKVKIVYQSPVVQTIWLLGDEIILWQPGINQAIKTSRRSQASKNSEIAFIATPYSSIPELKRQFNIVYLGDEDGRAKLELTPKSRSSLQKMIMWVDQTTWLPMKYQVTESNGKVTTFSLSDVQKNSIVSDRQFKADIPAGAKIINR